MYFMYNGCQLTHENASVGLSKKQPNLDGYSWDITITNLDFKMNAV